MTPDDLPDDAPDGVPDSPEAAEAPELEPFELPLLSQNAIDRGL